MQVIFNTSCSPRMELEYPVIRPAVGLPGKGERLRRLFVQTLSSFSDALSIYRYEKIICRDTGNHAAAEIPDRPFCAASF